MDDRLETSDMWTVRQSFDQNGNYPTIEHDIEQTLRGVMSDVDSAEMFIADDFCRTMLEVKPQGFVLYDRGRPVKHGILTLHHRPMVLIRFGETEREEYPWRIVFVFEALEDFVQTHVVSLPIPKGCDVSMNGKMSKAKMEGLICTSRKE